MSELSKNASMIFFPIVRFLMLSTVWSIICHLYMTSTKDDQPIKKATKTFFSQVKRVYEFSKYSPLRHLHTTG